MKKNLLLFLAGLLAYAGHSQIITTVAGGGLGNGQVATNFGASAPSSTATDQSGNFYYAANNFIFKVSVATGVQTIVAGTGQAGYTGDGGAATSAEIFGPDYIALDAAGDIYIADAHSVIRKVTAATGIITTVAGNGTEGYSGDGGAATSAELYYPTCVAIDASGNLYIADAYNQRIRKVAAATGIITTVAGDASSGNGGNGGAATSAELNFPSAVAVDASGNLYISDQNNFVIRKVAAATGIISTVVGTGSYGYSGDGGAATSAVLSNPKGVALDASGNLYITDGNNEVIRKVSATTGIITTVAGNHTAGYSGDGGAATAAELNSITSVAIDASGNLYITDQYDDVVRKVTAATGIITTVAGNGTPSYGGNGGLAAAAQLSNPSGVALDASGNLYIADEQNYVVRKVAVATGIISTVVGNGTYGNSGDGGAATAAALSSPAGVATDPSGNLYVADVQNNVVRKVNAATGIISTVAGDGTGGYTGDGGPATAAELNGPYGIALDAAGNLYIADGQNNAIRKVAAATGIISTAAGNGTSGYTGDLGAATAAQLSNPIGVAVDASGDLYIADYDNNVIREVTAATGIISTVAGSGTGGYSGDGGAATAAELSFPAGVALDASGDLYITDQHNNRIRKVTAATGIISTVAGNGTSGYTGDGGAATAAEINTNNANSNEVTAPDGIALDASGNLYIADKYNNVIRKVSAPGPNTWTGALSTAWATAGNWSVAVPTSTTDGIIPNTANKPVISSAASARNLYIESGASLTIGSGQTLIVYGSLTNSGTPSLGSGTLYMNGALDTLYGYSVVNNLTIASSYSTIVGIVPSPSRVDVTGVLNLASGFLGVNSPAILNLLSTASQTAYIEDNAGTYLGIANIERYVGGSTGYHFISSPLSGATLAALSGFTISGTNGTQASLVGKEGTLEDYVETTNTTNSLNNGYYNYTTLSNPLTSGMGLTAKINAGSTVTFSGTPASGNISYPITAQGANATTRGWNFVGNPYPSPISWTVLKAANSNLINGTCYIWKPTSATAGSWEAYNGGTGLGSATDVIALGQGFFILYGAGQGASTNLTFNTTMHFNSLTPPFYKTNMQPDEVRLKLTSATESAEAVAYTEAGRTTGFDPDVDGLLPPVMGENMQATSVAFASEGQDYIIHVIDAINDNTVMPLSIHTATPGTYTLSASALNVNGPAYLLDNTTGKYYDLNSESATIQSTGSQDYNNYSVVFKKATDGTSAAGVNIWGTEGNINITRSMNTPAGIIVTDIIGQEITSTTTTNSSVMIPVQTSGVYLVREQEANGAVTVKKVFVK